MKKREQVWIIILVLVFAAVLGFYIYQSFAYGDVRLAMEEPDIDKLREWFYYKHMRPIPPVTSCCDFAQEIIDNMDDPGGSIRGSLCYECSKLDGDGDYTTTNDYTCSFDASCLPLANAAWAWCSTYYPANCVGDDSGTPI